jgi:hypothetical protein
VTKISSVVLHREATKITAITGIQRFNLPPTGRERRKVVEEKGY